MRSTHAPFTVVVVEDNVALRHLMTRLLETTGYLAVALETCEAALDRVHCPDVDVVLTDWQMPGMTGLELARRIRSIRPDLPVIVTSGYRLEPDEVPAGVGFLPKPFGAAELGAALEAALTVVPAA